MATASDISYRYAAALLDAADERGALSRIRVEASGLLDIVDASPEFIEFLYDRSLMPDIKQRILSQIFEGKVDTITFNFLRLVVSKQRERFLPDILRACQALLDEREGIVNAQVTSAVPLSTDQEERLKKCLAGFTGKRIRMKTGVDASLVGGFVVQVGDTVIDSTLTTQLRRIRQALTGR
ncbi:MAG: ATP synthase F1 subunit delta [candidate division Zixibacteria bacterium]|nr:ATP synthase F1 subunit delta [candidate division Zixibacteria bacterium]